MNTAFCVALVIAGICAITDLRRRKIYNVITLPAIAGGLAYHGYLGGVQGVVASLVGVVFGLFIIILPFLLGGTGAGDSKLLAALGAWLPLPGIVYVFVIAGLACGIASLTLLFIRNVHLLRHPVMAFASMRFGIIPLPATSAGKRELPPILQKSFAIPFGLPVAIGVGCVTICQLLGVELSGVADLHAITKGGLP